MLSFILHNVHCMVAFQVLEVCGDVILGYSKASIAQYRGTSTTYMFAHGQYEPILSSSMQSCS